MSSKIKSVKARQVLDSRGNPTVEAYIQDENNLIVSAIVPSGASTGKHEAVELRDNNANEYMGKSVRKAIDNVNNIIQKALIGKDPSNQVEIDKIMNDLDGSDNKKVLGANAILSVSIACAHLSAKQRNVPLFEYINPEAHILPIPLMNILNGGAHADNTVDFQEFMVVPRKADSFSEALHMGVCVFHNLKKVLQESKYTTNVGDEGGFAPALPSNEAAMETVLKAIEKAGYKPGEDIWIAMDAATTEMYNEETKLYKFYKSTNKEISSEEMVDYWANWVKKYPICSIEDGMAEDDWEGWELLNARIGNACQLVGDDLFVTNVKRLQRGIDSKAANSILVKINQIGTLTETAQAIHLAKENNFTSIMSHRSGESEDTTIADLSVAYHCGQIKTGSASRTDRIAKYNQLLRIEEYLGSKAKYAKWKP